MTSRRGVAAVVAVAATTFVGTSWLMDLGDSREPSEAAEFRRPTVSPRALTAPGARAGSVAESLELAGVLSGEVGRVRAACMAEQGYDQVGDAVRARRAAAGTGGGREPLTVLPVEFGPSTHEEARTYGFAGGSLAVDDGDVGTVVSRDPAFDRASDLCDHWLYTEVAPELQDLQTRTARLSESAVKLFHDEVVNLLEPTVERRLACVRGSYPALPSWTELQQMGEEDVLHRVGVAPGRVRPGRGVEPSEGLVEAGEVRVFPPSEPDTYEATAGEVRFSTVYADCGDDVGFGAALDRATAKARSVVERRFGGEAEPVVQEVDENLRALKVELVAP